MKTRFPLILLTIGIVLLSTTQCQLTQPTEPTQPAASSPPAETVSPPPQNDLRIAVVTHGQAKDPFWAVIKRGIDQAAQDVGAVIDYHAPETFDSTEMARMIDEAVASEPDGLIVSIPDADALSPSIKAAVNAGIPVISINSGSEVAKELGVLTHVGQTEYEAGYSGGLRMVIAGVRHGLCVNHEIGNKALDLRCEGFAKAMEMVQGSSDVLAIDIAEPEETKERIIIALEMIPEIDGILTLGPTAIKPILEVLEERERLDEIELATFDLSNDALEAIENGDMLFAIDQQPYLQGYLPIVMLMLYHTNANTPAQELTATGPAFVTRQNVHQVTDLIAAGTR